MTQDKSRFTFPVGYYEFHKDQVFNFQLNRWYSWGYARLEDMREAGEKIDTFEDWKKVMLELAEKAVAEERVVNAAFYYRAAEFYVLSDYDEKEVLYEKFCDLFSEAFKSDNIERHKIAYGDAFLPAMKIPAAEKKGTIVMHGGFDSLMEEFYSWMRYFSDHGYEVIAFEGPGQGAARRKYGLALDYEWEKPVGALLDYFGLEDVTLLGISMGGWFCLRAAAFEPRIQRVIATGHSIDYIKTYNFVLRKLHMFFYKYFRDFTNRMSQRAIKKGEGMEAWMISNLMYITKKETAMDAFEAYLQLSEENLHSELVHQDVLILAGREDHFIPFKMYKKQIDALVNARSVTGRVFTREEHAHNHCQVGNTGLALDVMIQWIEGKLQEEDL